MTKRRQLFLKYKQTIVDISLCGATVFVAIVFRCYHLSWGLPNPEHINSYHPDEITVIAPTMQLNIFSGEMNPHFFNYGSLFIYAIYFAKLFAEGYGWLNLSVTNFTDWTYEFAKIHLLGRWLSVLCGVATVVTVFLWVKRICGRKPAVSSALLLAFFPMHVQHCHFATVDSPLTLLTTLSLYIAVTSMNNDHRMILSAFLSGLTTAVKYSVAPSLWITLAILWCWKGSRQENLKRLAFITVFMAFGFFCGCPYALLAPKEFWKDFYWETFVHTKIGHGYLFVNTGNGHWFHLTTNLPSAVGIPSIVLSLFGLASTFWFRVKSSKREGQTAYPALLHPTLCATVIFTLTYFVPLGFVQIRFARYLMPLLPILALWVGISWTINHSPIKKFFQIATILSLFYTLLCGLAVISLFSSKDPRDEAAEYTRQKINQLKQPIVALHDLPWFYTPPICPFNGGIKTATAFNMWQKDASISIVLVKYDLDKLLHSKSSLFITSDFEYSDRLRLKHYYAERFYRWLYNNKKHVKVFRKEPNLPLVGVFRWYVNPIPHDMRYVNPIVKVFLLSHVGNDTPFSETYPLIPTDKKRSVPASTTGTR